MAKNEAKIKFTAETGGFNQAIQKANNEMSELRAELKLNETQMRATGATVEGLEKKHSILASQLSAAQDKTEALNQKVQKAVEIFGENSQEATKLKVQLLNAQTAEEKLRQAVEKCANELEQQSSAAKETESATERLTSEIESQQSELDQLKADYVDAVLQYGKTSTEARDLAKQISKLSGELADNQSELGKAVSSADKLDKSFDSAGDAARESADGFDVAKGAIADLAADAISAAISKISEFISYLAELPEATRELRQDMATLETSFESANFTTEQGTQLWKDLYTVFGEDDRAVEASNLIAKMSDSQQDLNDWVKITTGIWGSYQDSLPVEGLAEASMETAKTGQVTGVLADALNWSSEAATMFADYMSEDVTTAEDAFNEALKGCTTEQERQALITETLTALYGDAATKYEEASGSQLAAKEATAENILVQNELANTLEPVTTAWQELKTDALEAIQPVIEAVSGVMVDAMGWMREHPVAMKAIAAAVGVVAAALTALIVVVTAYTVAQWAMNSAILANPITWIIVAIVAAVAALVAVLVLVIEYWDEIVAAVKRCWESICETLSQWGAWINANVIQPVASFFTGLWDGIVNAATAAWDWICNAVSVAVQFIGAIISAAFQIITLPFRFIWENCKEYVFAAWEWIKTKVSAAINAVRSIISMVMNAIKTVFTTVWNAIKTIVDTVVNAIKTTVSNVWNAIKNATSTAFNAVKSVASSVWNSIKSAITNVVNGVKSTVSGVWNGIKSTTSSVFNGIKSTATSVWNAIKTAITKPIDTAKSHIQSAINAIKGFFANCKLKFPNIKLPHFSITGSFSLAPPSVPKLSISWYKDGAIFMKPTLFNTPFGMKGVGEAGAEAVLPIDKLEGYISGAIEKAQTAVNFDTLAAAIEDLANRPIALDINGKRFAYATASDTDNVGGMRSIYQNRGLALE